MIDEKQADATATDVADADSELTNEQVWAKITGLDADHDDAKATSDAAEVDNQEDATIDAENEETADKAVSKDKGDGEGDAPKEQSQDYEKRLKGQISGQTRKIQELQREIANFKASKGADAPADLDELRDEYPEIVGPMLDQQKALRERLDEMSTQMARFSELQRYQVEDTERVESDTLDREHPGWFDFLRQQGRAFSTWVDDQPAALRNVAAANMDSITDGQGLSDLLNRYKAHLQGGTPTQSAAPAADLKRELSPRRQRQKDGMMNTPSRGNSAVSANPGPDETDRDAIWAHITKSK